MELIITINDDNINCQVYKDGINMIIKGSLKNVSNYNKRILCAPNPPDIRMSYSGTALPFPCEEIAFEKTKNYYEISNNGIIDVIFKFPNSYYEPEGLKKIISPIVFIFDDKKIIYETKDFYPLKTLRTRSKGDPSFYAIKEMLLPVADAEDTMNNYSLAKVKYNIA